MKPRRIAGISPASFPFPYGWIIVAAGTAGLLMTAPGQTVGVTVFNDYLIAALRIDRVTLSSAYMVGTLLSAVLLARAGRLLDRYGARVVGAAAAAGLGFSLLGMTQVDRATSFLGALTARPGEAALIMLSIGFFLLRFFGQGVLMMSSRNMVMKWFDRRRSLVDMVLGISVTLGFAWTPRVYDSLITRYSWQSAWAIIGGAGLIFALIAMLLYRDNPYDVGLVPDGPRSSGRPGRKHGLFRLLSGLAPRMNATGPDRTLKEARRTLTFWVFNLVLTLSSIIGTAFTFHIVSIFQNAGLTRSAAIAVIFPASLFGIGVKFAATWACGRLPIRIFPIVHAGGVLLLLVSTILLGSPGSIFLVIAALGISQGVLTVNANLAWPRLFGLAELGAVSGLAMTWSAAGSAVGPYVYSLFFSLTGSYTMVSLLFTVPTVLLLFLALFAHRHNRESAATADSHEEECA